ncbi:hypothetical protein GCM10008904_16740 [Paraclostridium ghonii]|uniref:Uncharacterized protein n=1 Tax=Paraclostridium ghonii TaxID=29358 RepID=A0ABU0MWD1_9FIRM|nr:hypothetical protein [Paeniclostridium ghonii]MDQ0554929.1 hypothetical protein [Paeniclostridium ghonii]
MIIEDLDLETRSKIYSFTKKILRKYQKGITTGKLTADKFAENILSNEEITSIINENLLTEEDFKDSYTSYIQTLIKDQNETINNSKRKKVKKTMLKPSISQQLQLKKLLHETGFELNIPQQYLDLDDVSNISKYISTGKIDLGNEKIYNYVYKIQKH